MKITISRKRACFSFAAALILFTIFSMAMKSPLHAGFMDSINEALLLSRLSGQGQFVGYERNVDTNDLLFPLEVLNDGYKMIRVYQDFPGNYTVEWSWRVMLKNKSSRAVQITFEYKLQDQDAFLVASSKEFYKNIAVGETVIIEKTDNLPFEIAKRATNSNWYIHLQN